MPQPSHCHVLTFNYDRMFEIAFLGRFNLDGYALYDRRVLNSGVPAISGIRTKILFEPEAFSFLKLHGSILGWPCRPGTIHDGGIKRRGSAGTMWRRKGTSVTTAGTKTVLRS